MNNFKDFRPPFFIGKGDRFLPQIAKDLTELLIETADSTEGCALSFNDKDWEYIAGILVEFAEDMHNDIGLWDFYERYNIDLFGTPLPLIPDPTPEYPLEEGTIDMRRIFHLIWILHDEMFPGNVLAIYNTGLWYIAETAAFFLQERFEDVPLSSGVESFLGQPNDYGWDVKKKLIWLGTKSYLFRISCSSFITAMKNEEFPEFDFNDSPEISEPIELSDEELIDIFVLKITTCWSGLGVTDFLAGVLDITLEQEKVLQMWYEPHRAYYKVLFLDSCSLKLLNVVNNEHYTVRIEKKDTRFFKPGHIISGDLLKWDGEWYWSAKPKMHGQFPKKELEMLIKDFIENLPGFVYIYDNDMLNEARLDIKNMYESFVNHFGSDLVVFPGGKEFSENMQKFLIQKRDEKLLHDPEVIEEVKEIVENLQHNEKIFENKNGIGVYFNPEEGYEIFENFNELKNGFVKKGGDDITQKEWETIYDFIVSDEFSPGFVLKMVKDYGYKSIFYTFLIPYEYDETCLEYLLRRYKGQFYRNRYPSFGLV